MFCSSRTQQNICARILHSNQGSQSSLSPIHFTLTRTTRVSARIPEFPVLSYLIPKYLLTSDDKRKINITTDYSGFGNETVLEISWLPGLEDCSQRHALNISEVGVLGLRVSGISVLDLLIYNPTRSIDGGSRMAFPFWNGTGRGRNRTSREALSMMNNVSNSISGFLQLQH